MSWAVRGKPRDLLFWLVLAAVPALTTAWLHPRAPEWRWTPPAVAEVTVATARLWGASTLWVDARESRLFSEGHVPTAVSLNETEWGRLLPGFLERWQPDQRVLVYCNAEQCRVSQEVALRLRRELGLEEIYVLKRGWNAWQRANR